MSGTNYDAMLTTLRSMEAWVKIWQEDARCNLKPTPGSLCDALTEIRAAIAKAQS